MTARPQDVALLPLPERLEKIASYAEALNFTAIHSSGGGHPVTITPVPGSIREAAAALASAQAREEELLAEALEWRDMLTAEKARAERLEEALRRIVAISDRKHDAWDDAKALLSTNAATQTGETT